MGDGTRHLARCATCGASFRVASREREYACKKCGGVVRAEEAAEPAGETAPLEAEGPAALPSCAACSAVLPRDADWCPECGADARRPRAPASRQEHAEHVRDLQQARASVELVRNMLWFEAALFLAGTLFVLLMLTDPHVPPGKVLAFAALPCAPLLVTLAAIPHAALHPFAWSLGIASLWTVAAIGGGWFVHAARGSIASIVLLVVTVGLWLAVLPTVRAGRILRRHSGSYTARAFFGVRAGRDVGADELLALARRTAWRRAGVLALGALGVVAAAAAVVWLGFRPRPLGPSLADFTDAWNRSDVEDATSWLAAEERGELRARLETVRRARGWSALPRLRPPPADASDALDKSVWLELEFAELEGGLASEWRRSGTRWTLARLDLPPPPLGPALDAFSSAWNASDADGVCALFEESLRLRGRAYLEQLARKRGWDAYPSVASTRVLPIDARYADAWHETADERFRTRWHVGDDDRWGIVTLDPPER